MRGFFATLGGMPLHDPLSASEVVEGLSVSAETNGCGSCSFTIHPTHPLYGRVSLRSRALEVVVTQGGTTVFEGFVWEVERGMLGGLAVTCKGCMAYLGDTLVRPYTTSRTEFNADPDKYDALAPSRPSEYFQWLVDQHNAHADPSRRFTVGRNELDRLRTKPIDRSATNRPTTADEITEKLLEPLGGFLVLRHEGGERVLDYLADAVDVNAQVIEFGENLADYVRTESTDDLATVCTAEGDGCTLDDATQGVDYGGGCVLRRGRLENDAAVARFGVIEGHYGGSDAEDPEELAYAAARWLMAASEPSVGIEVSAVDMALYTDARPLQVGQLVRVRSMPHGIDAYMTVAAIEIGATPDASTYRLGVPTSDLARQLTARMAGRVEPVSQAAMSASIGASAAAAEAKAKSRVFRSQPVPPYDAGDLWVDDSGPETIIRVCLQSRSE